MQIHIGKEIEREYEKSGMKLAEFAKRINTSSRNVYSIFERKEIKTDQLQKICEILKFDFFALYKVHPQAGKTEEALFNYSSKPNKVMILIELDGQPITLEQSIRKITAVNNSLKSF